LTSENPEPVYFGEKLKTAVEEGYISQDIVDNSVKRILGTLFRFITAEDPQTYDENLICCKNTRPRLEAAERNCIAKK